VGKPTITLTDAQKLEFYRSFELRSLALARLQWERMNPDYQAPPAGERPPTMGTPAGRGPATYACLHLLAGALVPDTLTAIDGWPAFADHATDWEQKWSVLCSRRHQFAAGSVCHTAQKPWTVSAYGDKCGRINQFTPVVVTNPLLRQFEFATVAAHHGTVLGDSLITNGPRAKDLQARRLSEEDGEVFVHSSFDRLPAGWDRYSHDEHEFTVLTTLTGQVTNILGASATGFVEASAFDPLDVIDASRLLVKLGAKGGSRLVTAVYRKRAGKAVPTSLSEPTARVVAKVAGHTAGDAAAAVNYTTYNRAAMGVPRKHFDAMVAAAKETDSIAVFRANKEVAVELIERGAVGKPKALSLPGFKTNPETGVLTAVTGDQISLVARTPDYYIVNAQGQAGRMVVRDGKEVYEELALKHPTYWDLRPGQVIHKSGHPVVGDYDLMGVMPVKSTGSAAVGVPKEGLKGDWLGPHVEEYMTALNPKLDKQRVLHGAQDQYHGPGGGFDDGVAYAVFPDGRAVILRGRAEQEAFYKAMKRQTPDGTYNPNLPADVPADELAARRARKKK
jgi:hypothetical protein